MKPIKAAEIDEIFVSEIESQIDQGNYKDALAALREAELQEAEILSNSARFLEIKARVLSRIMT
jgi:hypothetical protein